MSMVTIYFIDNIFDCVDSHSAFRRAYSLCSRYAAIEHKFAFAPVDYFSLAAGFAIERHEPARPKRLNNIFISA